MSEPTVHLRIDDLAFDGKAVAHRDGKVVFLDSGLPGETVVARIVKSKPRYDQGRVIEILDRADARVDARCEHFDYCGGCSWQDLDYNRQIEIKKRHVAECLARIGGFDDIDVRDTLPADPVFGYRNKMEFSFHVVGEDDFRLGLHRRGRFDDVFDINYCHLQSEIANRIVHVVRDFVRSHQIPVYDVRKHRGYMRFLVIRETTFTRQLMVNIVTNLGEFAEAEDLVSELIDKVPQITTIVHGRNGKKSNIAVAEEESILYGPGYIEEELLGLRFGIKANSFFQTNSVQAGQLYETAFGLLDTSGMSALADLYCGTGTIGLLLASRIGRVIGVELVEDAIAMARWNAERNSVENIVFHQGHVREFLRDTASDLGSLDAVVVDPPRAGLHPKALRQLIRMSVPRMLYISCNPATFARDARALADAGYRISPVHPVDMFPHTRHIELTALFSR